MSNSKFLCLSKSDEKMFKNIYLIQPNIEQFTPNTTLPPCTTKLCKDIYINKFNTDKSSCLKENLYTAFKCILHVNNLSKYENNVKDIVSKCNYRDNKCMIKEINAHISKQENKQIDITKLNGDPNGTMCNPYNTSSALSCMYNKLWIDSYPTLEPNFPSLKDISKDNDYFKKKNTEIQTNLLKINNQIMDTCSKNPTCKIYKK